jgi:CHAD domain-containing protein
MARSDEPSREDPTPPDARAAQLEDDPDDEIYPDPDSSVEVTPPVDVVTVDHAEAGLEPPQVDDPDIPAPGSVVSSRHVVHRLTVHGLFRLPDLSASTPVVDVAHRDATTHSAVYYDTADLRLARWGISLRRLEGDGQPGWHLELPVDMEDSGQTDDVRLPLKAGKAGKVPTELAEMVTAFTRSAVLQPIAELRTERVPVVLYDADGLGLAVLTDDTVSVLDGERIAARFRELQVEALTEAGVDAVVDALLAAGAMPAPVTTAVAALGPTTQEPPDVSAPQVVGPKDSAGAAVTAHLRRHARALLLQDMRVRRDLPDSVHQMRVAARRLRSGLKAFEPMLDVEWAEALRTELGWVAGELGVSRDTEVLQARLDHHADEVGEDLAPLIRGVVDPALSARWRDAREHALGAMVSRRYRDFLDMLVDGVRRPRLNELAQQSGESVLPGLVDKAWRKLAKEVRLLRLDGESEPWHEARIRAKKARYAAEAVAPVMGEHVKQFAKALSKVTEILGEHQDAWVAQNTLRELAADEGVDGLSGFALGVLNEFEFEQELFDRTDFVELWPSVEKAHKKARLH